MGVSNGGGRRRSSRRRAILAVVVIAALLCAALLAAIGSLNRDLYSASGFVRQYLDAIARRDTTSALQLPGVELTNQALEAAKLPRDLPTTLLRPDVLSELTDIHLIRETEDGAGTHTVLYGFRLDGKPESMMFSVAHTGTFAGVFNSWRFASSPLAVLQITVLHEASFTVNGLTLDTRAHAAADTPATFSNQASYLAFAPTSYSIAHTSTLLSASVQRVPVTKSTAVAVSVDAEPNEAFISQVQTELNGFLDDCTTQQVLQPSNCPFGIEINDRIKNDPVWSIADYPVVALTAGATTFEMADTTGQAHIVVEVQSLFDGDVETRDEDVPFAVALSVTVKPDGSLAIQLH